jgi:hypothetical protein
VEIDWDSDVVHLRAAGVDGVSAFERSVKLDELQTSGVNP